MPVTKIPVPGNTIVSRYLPGADFYDAYQLPLAELRLDAATHADTDALHLYLCVARKTPAWIDALMGLRNRVVRWFGLKNLGHLHSVGARNRVYQEGDRVGIFSIKHLSADEVVLTDADKHLDVFVSVLKHAGYLTVSTVVRCHNRLGHVYMFFVGPAHGVIAPAMLRQSQVRN